MLINFMPPDLLHTETRWLPFLYMCMQFDPICVARMHTSAEEHAHICTVGVPVQIFPPLDILPPAFLEEHVLGEMCEEGCVCVCGGGCWLPYLLTARGDGFQPVMIWARVRQPILAHSSAGQEAETLESWLWHLGAGGGDRRGVLWSRGAACVHLGTYTRPQRVRLASGSAAWFSLMQPLSCRCPLVQQDGSAALPSAFCPHPREMSCPFEWSSRHTPGDSMAGTVWKLCPEVAFYSFLK